MNGPTLAVLGGGQLGRMLGLSGVSMGVRMRFLDPGGASCSAGAVGTVVGGSFDDEGALARLVEGLGDGDAVTYEFENVPASSVAWLETAGEAAGFAVRPSARSLEVAQDRKLEKELFKSAGIETGRWASVDFFTDLKGAWSDFGEEAGGLVVKTRRGGYDGKGQAVVRDIDRLQAAWDRLGSHPGGLVAEAFVGFERERSVVVARAASGSVKTYPSAVNVHRDGILVRSEPGDRHMAARDAAVSVAEQLGHVGVLAVEFFELADGSVLANELAPRVHNTGHWTTEGCGCSQFENHVRASLGWDLGETALVRGCVMINVIGDVPDAKALAAIPGAHVHLYGKAGKPGRKVGHLTVTGDGEDAIAASIERVEAALGIGSGAGWPFFFLGMTSG